MADSGSSTRGLRRPRMNAELRNEDRVKPLELFFDLVFVLGFTQCTALMAADPTWEGLARGMLALAVLWWAWVGYAWLTSVLDPEEGGVRLAMFAAMVGLLVVALCVPDVFGDRALPFAVAYALVRAAHIGLFLIAARDDDDLRRSTVGLGVSTGIAVGLLVGAAFVDGPAQWALWIVAIVIDFGGPAVTGADGWKLAPGHFAERHNLVILLALGESIVALGIGARVELDWDVYTVALLGIGLAAAIWWIYFDVVALVTEVRLVRAEEGRPRNTLARDSYSYLHFPMVAGIILAAYGLEEVVAHLDDPLHDVPAFALFGGVAIYLLGHVTLRLRNAGTISRTRLGAAIVLVALWPFAGEVSALLALAVVNVLVWPMIAYETSRYDDRRYRLRHRLDIEPPSRG